MPKGFPVAVLAVSAAVAASQGHAACGTFTLSGPAATHEAYFNDMDNNGAVSAGDSLVGQRTLEDLSGTTIADLFFVGTVESVDTQTGAALRPTKYVYDFGVGTIFGSQDFTLPVEDFRDPPGRGLSGAPHSVRILGGTGAYQNARGQIAFELTEAGDGVYTFALDCDLVGTWIGETTIILETEGRIVETPRIHTIVIEEITGNLVRGHRTWRSPADADPGYVGDAPTTDASEPFIGALSADGDALRLVETEDSGILIGEVLGPDAIEFTYLEAAPHAVVYSAIYTRQQ